MAFSMFLQLIAKLKKNYAKMNFLSLIVRLSMHILPTYDRNPKSTREIGNFKTSPNWRLISWKVLSAQLHQQTMKATSMRISLKIRSFFLQTKSPPLLSSKHFPKNIKENFSLDKSNLPMNNLLRNSISKNILR